MPKLDLFIPLSKVDIEKRLVYGVMTSAVVDRSKEQLDYEGTKPYIEKWSKSVQKDSSGKSVGNVRYMHQPIVAGHLEDIHLNDAQQQVEICAKITDDKIWKQVQEGDLTGFSMGGEYVDVKKIGDVTKYIANPVEVSVVDRPCVPNATFTLVKADGSTEAKPFLHYETVEKAAETAVAETAAEDTPTELAKADEGEQDYATVSGTKVHRSDFAYAPEGSKPSEWKLPIHDASHARDALARFNQTELPDSAKAGVHARIVEAAHKFGIKVGEEHHKAAVAYNILSTPPISEHYAGTVAALQKTLQAFEKNLGVEDSGEKDMSKIHEHLKEACDMAKALSDHLKEKSPNSAAHLMCKALHEHLKKGADIQEGSEGEANDKAGVKVEAQADPVGQFGDIGKAVQAQVEKTMVAILEKVLGPDATVADSGVKKAIVAETRTDMAKAETTEFDKLLPESNYGNDRLTLVAQKFAAAHVKPTNELPNEVAMALAGIGR